VLALRPVANASSSLPAAAAAAAAAGVAPGAPTVPLPAALALAAAAAAGDAGAAALLAHPPLVGALGPLSVRLRDAGLALVAGGGNAIYVALVRERLGADGTPTWSPWGPAEPAVGAPWRAPPAAGDDAAGAAGAPPATAAVRAWAAPNATAPGFLVTVLLPHPAALLTARARAPAGADARAGGSVTAPARVPAALLGGAPPPPGAPPAADVTAAGAWRLHVLLVQPSASEGSPRRAAALGLAARFWRSRAEWAAGAPPAGAAGADRDALDFGPPPARAPPLWTRAARAGAALAVFTGFLVPPATAGVTFRLACDGPCGLELDGVALAAWNGTAVTAGRGGAGGGAGGAGASPPARVLLASGDGSGAEAVPLREGQAYALRAYLQRPTSPPDPGAPPAQGALRVTWSWPPPAPGGGERGEGAEGSPDAPVPPECLRWGAEHIAGSPYAVWAA